MGKFGDLICNLQVEKTFCESWQTQWSNVVSMLDSGSNNLSSSPGGDHCVVALGKTPFSHNVSLHPCV